jgi:hypothetical protein
MVGRRLIRGRGQRLPPPPAPSRRLWAGRRPMADTARPPRLPSRPRPSAAHRGGVTILGNPTNAAKPVTEGLLWRYASWLEVERRFLIWELGDHTPARYQALCDYIRVNNAGGRLHQPGGLEPSTRAAVVLFAVGCDWREGSRRSEGRPQLTAGSPSRAYGAGDTARRRRGAIARFHSFSVRPRSLGTASFVGVKVGVRD